MNAALTDLTILEAVLILNFTWCSFLSKAMLRHSFGEGVVRLRQKRGMASLLFLLSCRFKESKNKPRIGCFLKKKPVKRPLISQAKGKQFK